MGNFPHKNPDEDNFLCLYFQEGMSNKKKFYHLSMYSMKDRTFNINNLQYLYNSRQLDMISRINFLVNNIGKIHQNHKLYNQYLMDLYSFDTIHCNLNKTYMETLMGSYNLQGNWPNILFLIKNNSQSRLNIDQNWLLNRLSNLNHINCIRIIYHQNYKNNLLNKINTDFHHMNCNSKDICQSLGKNL